MYLAIIFEYRGLYALLVVRDLQYRFDAVVADALRFLEGIDNIVVGGVCGCVPAGQQRLELVCEDGGVFDCAVFALTADGVELLALSVRCIEELCG